MPCNSSILLSDVQQASRCCVIVRSIHLVDMNKINIAEVPTEHRLSPKGRYELHRQHISLSLGGIKEHRTMKTLFLILSSFGILVSSFSAQPNVVIILADDLGYGDLACYGSAKIQSPYLDQMAAQGAKLTHFNCPASFCAPTRASLMTGRYPFRCGMTQNPAPDGGPVADALALPKSEVTLAQIMKSAGYATGMVGKWHLGLGPKGGPDWNGDIKPGPLEIGFTYSFLLPATADRVPCVYVENHRIVGLDPKDPVQVSYKGPIGNEPTGKEHPELLKMKY